MAYADLTDNDRANIQQFFGVLTALANAELAAQKAYKPFLAYWQLAALTTPLHAIDAAEAIPRSSLPNDASAEQAPTFTDINAMAGAFAAVQGARAGLADAMQKLLGTIATA